MLPKGMLLQNRYRITRPLAQGGMGAVYEAEAVHLGGHRIAVKETFFDEDQHVLRQQFQREASTLARLNHPALPRVIDHFTEGEGQFLVMEFINGDDLGKLLEERSGGFPVEWVLEWADTILDALNYIHTQHPPVIHRDIKPQNLKLTPAGKIFLIDFGLAKDATTPTRPGKSLHAFTAAYAPPEQIKGEGTDFRSDLFSLGATLYQLLTGEAPLDVRVRAETMRYTVSDPLRLAHQLNPQVPFSLSAIIMQAMAIEKDDRFESAAAMRLSLQVLRQEQDIMARMPPPEPKTLQPVILQTDRAELRRTEEQRFQGTEVPVGQKIQSNIHPSDPVTVVYSDVNRNTPPINRPQRTPPYFAILLLIFFGFGVPALGTLYYIHYYVPEQEHSQEEMQRKQRIEEMDAHLVKANEKLATVRAVFGNKVISDPQRKEKFTEDLNKVSKKYEQVRERKASEEATFSVSIFNELRKECDDIMDELDKLEEKLRDITFN
jgi:serine/threonine protein kinase